MANLAIVPPATVSTDPRIFRVFISYASEDASIAVAIHKCLTAALPEVFTEIYLDKQFLQPGDKFKPEIESKLEKTDVLIIVYTGVEKPSHGYTGWEVGFFDHVMKTASRPRKKVPMFLESLPATAIDDQGISLNVGRDKLEQTIAEFEADLVVDPEDPLCRMIEAWQDEVGDLIKAAGFVKPVLRPEQDAIARVKNLRLEIFRYLKTTVAITMKPQKQITIKAKGAALQAASQSTEKSLPPDAELAPIGSGGTMAIFGLPDTQTTWEKFLNSIAGNEFRESWKDAITSVVMSSFPDKINVDNSQVIVSTDARRAYRIILTTATKYYDDNREFNLYFVEALQRSDYGNKDTTLLLKGLELVCRFRFLFLEKDSEFFYMNVQLRRPEQIVEITNQLQRELLLLRKDSRDAGLEHTNVWSRFVTWEHLEKMASVFRPLESKIQSVIGEILRAKGDESRLIELRQELSALLKELEENIRPENTLLLHEMATKLEEITSKEAD